MDDDKALTADGASRLPSRRDMLAGTGAVGLMLMNASSVFAQGADGANTIRVGFVSPRTGPLASFGETDGYVLDVARKSLAGGLVVGGKKYAVEILDRDTQSDPARASQLAKALIDSSKVDLMLTTSTPEVTNPVADACEAAGVPCLATVLPWESFYFGRGAKPGQPSPFKWSFVFSFGVAQFAEAFASGWSELPTNKRVAALYPNDADGNAVREHLAPLLEKAGFTVIDAGPYEDGTTDYSAQIAKFKAAKCDIFNTFPIPPDFAAFWRQAAQQGLTKTIKIAQIAKTGLFPSSITALGPLGYNLTSAVYWHKTFPYKSPLTGVTGVQLADGYEKASNKPWTQQLGASMSLLDAGFETLKACSDPKNKASVLKALSTLKTTTMVGKVDFTNGPEANVSTTPIINAQWIKAAPGSRFKLDYVIVENACDRNVPVAAKLRPYNA